MCTYCPACASCDWEVTPQVYATIATMLPTGAGLVLELYWQSCTLYALTVHALYCPT